MTKGKVTMNKKLEMFKTFINRTVAYLAAMERDGREIDRRCQEAKDEFYKRHGIYFRGGF
jgi:hypothetical protein